MQTPRLAPRLVVFTLVRTVLNTAYRMVYPFLPTFARGLGVDLSLLSNIMAIRALGGALGPFIATLADRRGRRLGILAGVGLFTLGSLLVVARPSFITFAIALLLLTFGKYIFDISMISWLGDRVPYERRGRVLAVTEFGWSLSFILGVPLVGFLIARWNWNSPFLLFTILGALGFVVLGRIIPRDIPQNAPGKALDLSLSSVFHSPAFLPILAGLSVGLFSSAANETVNLLFGVWLEDAFGLQIAALGAASAVIGFSELGGEGLVALFVDRLGKKRAIMLGLCLNSLFALALPVLGRSTPGALVGLFFFYISFEFTLVSSIPLMTELLPQARATIMSLAISGELLGRALGAFASPRLYFLGFGAVAVGAVVFNLVALFAASRLGKKHR